MIEHLKMIGLLKYFKFIFFEVIILLQHVFLICRFVKKCVKALEKVIHMVIFLYRLLGVSQELLHHLELWTPCPFPL